MTYVRQNESSWGAGVMSGADIVAAINIWSKDSQGFACIKADHITLNGYISNDNNSFSIDANGNMTCNNATINGTLTGTVAFASDAVLGSNNWHFSDSGMKWESGNNEFWIDCVNGSAYRDYFAVDLIDSGWTYLLTSSAEENMLAMFTSGQHMWLGTDTSHSLGLRGETIVIGTSDGNFSDGHKGFARFVTDITVHDENGYGARGVLQIGYVDAPNWYNTSSREYKKDIQELKDYGDIIDSLVPVSFKYRPEHILYEDGIQFGLIYEDTIDILPEICHHAKYNNGEERKMISYPSLIPILLKEIQSLRKRVLSLEQKG